MITVVTGPSYSGRLTMAQHIQKELKKSQLLPIATTDCHLSNKRLPSNYRHVPRSDFAEMEADRKFITASNFGEHRYGVEKSIFEDAYDGINIIVCDPEGAAKIGAFSSATDLKAVCVYLHCSIKTMLFRRAAEQQSHSSADLDVVHEVYGNHSLYYSSIVSDSELNKGYSTVIPVNTDMLGDRRYYKNVVEPLIARLESEFQ